MTNIEVRMTASIEDVVKETPLKPSADIGKEKGTRCRPMCRPCASSVAAAPNDIGISCSLTGAFHVDWFQDVGTSGVGRTPNVSSSKEMDDNEDSAVKSGRCVRVSSSAAWVRHMTTPP